MVAYIFQSAQVVQTTRSKESHALRSKECIDAFKVRLLYKNLWVVRKYVKTSFYCISIAYFIDIHIYIYIHSLKLFLNISACGSFFPSSNSHFFTHDAPPFFGHSFAITTWNFPGARQWTVDISGQPLPVIWPMLICLCVMDDSTFQPHISMERPDNFLAGSQLGGGFKYCLCSSLFGEMIPF